MSDWQKVDFGHTPYDAAFGRGDVYDVGHKPERAGKRPLSVAIAGCGGVAQAKWIPAINRLRTIGEPVRIAGVAEPDRATLNKAAALCGSPGFSSLGDLLAAGRPDVLLVLASDAHHVALARQAIEAGVPCLVEKPLARDFSQAAALARLAEERGVLLAAVANKRFSPPYAQARALIEAGALKSAPTVFTGKFTLGYPYVDLLEGGTVHLLDLLLWFMGPVKNLHARGIWGRVADSSASEKAATPNPSPQGEGGSDLRHPQNSQQTLSTGSDGSEDSPSRLKRGVMGGGNDPHSGRLISAVISFGFASGAIGTIMTSAAGLSFGPWERVEILGRNAFLTVDNQIELALHDDENGPAKIWRPSVPNTLMFDESFAGYSGLLENVLEAVRGTAPLAATGRDGAAAVALIEATRRSLARGAEIDLAAEGLLP